jgi:creatinine amidohydrolase/Fe(II)-dependent formamide hydrolase-like protein
VSTVRPVVTIGQALDFTGDTGQTGVAQSTCKNNFKQLLTSRTNQTWCVAFVNDHKQGNEPCTHK